jgi:hypothetical protein
MRKTSKYSKISGGGGGVAMVVVFTLAVCATDHLEKKKGISAQDASAPVSLDIEVGGNFGHANGVYFSNDGGMYFVTARHALYDSISGHVKNVRALLYSTSVKEKDTTPLRYSIDLRVLDSAGCLHQWEDLDIAAALITKDLRHLSPGVKVHSMPKVFVTAFSVDGIVKSNEIDWPCKVSLIGYPTIDDSSSLSNRGLTILSGRVISKRSVDGTIETTYRGRPGLSGAPVFVNCDKPDFNGALLLGIHTNTVEWSEPEDTSRIDMVSKVVCADEIFKRLGSAN